MFDKYFEKYITGKRVLQKCPCCYHLLLDDEFSKKYGYWCNNPNCENSIQYEKGITFDEIAERWQAPTIDESGWIPVRPKS